MKIHNLSYSEKILVVEQLWDSIRAETESSSMTSAQKTELDNRLTDFELNLDDGDSEGQDTELVTDGFILRKAA